MKNNYLYLLATAILLLSSAGCALATEAIDLHAYWDQRCAQCHGKVSEFARQSLLINDGNLVGRTSGRKLADFLLTHGRVKPDEVQSLVSSLTRVRMEVSAPLK